MKNSKLFALGFFALVTALFLVGSALAGGGSSPILRAVPAQSTWIADGFTQYSIMIQADSTPMNGLATSGVNLRYIVPVVEGYTFNVVSVSTNPSNDFFAGASTVPFIGGTSIGRLVSGGVMPSNRVGNFAEIRFTVTQNVVGRSAIVQTSLEFDSSIDETLFLLSDYETSVSPVIQSTSFTIQPRFQSIAAHAAIACSPEDC